MAGYPRGAETAYVGSHFGNGNGPFLLDELNCQGHENSILDCKFNPWRQHDCRVSEWAGVVCKLGMIYLIPLFKIHHLLNSSMISNIFRIRNMCL